MGSCRRSDIDLPNYFVTYEFSVVPRSLFTMDGFLHQTSDKATIAREIRKLYHDDLEDMLGDDRRQRKVMIIGWYGCCGQNKHLKNRK